MGWFKIFKEDYTFKPYYEIVHDTIKDTYFLIYHYFDGECMRWEPWGKTYKVIAKYPTQHQAEKHLNALQQGIRSIEESILKVEAVHGPFTPSVSCE